MNKNDISLSFEKAEYYTLQEACDYLNLKNNINNLTAKKLLKQICKYNINTYIHFRMDYLYDERLDIDLYFSGANIKDNEKIDISLIYDRLEKNIKLRLIDDLYVGYFLFLVNNMTIENMSLSNQNNCKVRMFGFDGFLTKDNLNENPNKPEILKKWGVDIDNHKYFAEEIVYICLKLNSNSDDTLQDFLSKFPYPCYFDKRSSDLVFIEFDIDVNDLIILDKDLMELEEKIINNAPIPAKTNTEIKPRKGVSIQKLQAKEQAKILARALWNNDKDKKIRIKEMAVMVYLELYNNGYERQLPNNKESLQDWIREIAPDYATAGGRPANES